MAFATLEFLAPVVALGAADFRGLDGLGVDAGGAGVGISSGGLTDLATQGVHDLLPGAVVTPTCEVIIDSALGQQVMGQHVPLAAAAVEVEQAVENLTQIDAAWPSARFGVTESGLQNGPLLVGQIRGIALAHGPKPRSGCVGETP